MESESPVAKRLVEHFEGRANTAAAFNLKSSEAIRLWLLNGIPPDRALEAEEKTGGAVTAEEALIDYRERRQDEARA